MNALSGCFALLLLSLMPVSAQTAIPAQPVDPHQARPALPVVPDSLTPPELAAPATNAASTNGAPSPAAPAPVLAIVADSSLRDVLQELAQTWADSVDSSPQVPLTLTNAGTLCARVEGGAKWDLIISADVGDVKAMTDKGLLDADGQCTLARNTLVIYGRKALLKDDDLEWFDLIGNEWKAVAFGNPDLVASGRVAQRALRKHDLLDDDHKQLFVNADTEKLAVAMVQQEKADAVFAYKTDLARVNLPGFEFFPLNTEDAPPIFYTAAVTRQSGNPALARAFIDYCGSDPAKAIWAKYGFETN